MEHYQQALRSLEQADEAAKLERIVLAEILERGRSDQSLEGFDLDYELRRALIYALLSVVDAIDDARKA